MLSLKDRKDQKIKSGDKVKFIWKDFASIFIVEEVNGEAEFTGEFITEKELEQFKLCLKELTDLDIELSSVIELVDS